MCRGLCPRLQTRRPSAERRGDLLDAGPTVNTKYIPAGPCAVERSQEGTGTEVFEEVALGQSPSGGRSRAARRGLGRRSWGGSQDAGPRREEDGSLRGCRTSLTAFWRQTIGWGDGETHEQALAVVQVREEGLGWQQ